MHASNSSDSDFREKPRQKRPKTKDAVKNVKKQDETKQKKDGNNRHDKRVIMMRNMEVFVGEDDGAWETGLYK